MSLFDRNRIPGDEPGIVGKLRRDRAIEFTDPAGDIGRLCPKRLLRLRVTRGVRLRHQRDELLVDGDRLLAKVLPLADARRQIAAAGRNPRRHSSNRLCRLFVAGPLRGLERAGSQRGRFPAVGLRELIGGNDRSREWIGRAIGLEIRGLSLACFPAAAAEQNGRRAHERIVGLLPVLGIQIVGAEIAKTVGDIRVRVAKRAQANFQRAFQQRFGLAGPPAVVENDRQIIEAAGDQRVKLAERLLADRQRAAGQTFRFGKTFIVADQHHEIVEGDGDIEMVLPEAFFANGQRFAKQPLRFLLAVGAGLCVGEIVQRNRNIRVIGPERLFLNCQRAKQQAFGFRDPALPREHEREVVEAGGDVGMIGPQRLFADGQRAP